MAVEVDGAGAPSVGWFPVVMRPVLVSVVVIGLVAPGVGSAQDSTCTVETRKEDGETFRVIRCDEDSAATQDGIAQAQASCDELGGEAQPQCYQAVVASFELRRQSMIRRALSEGATVDAVASEYDASLEAVQQVQAEMAPPEDGSDPEIDAARAAARVQAEQDLADWMAQEGLAFD